MGYINGIKTVIITWIVFFSTAKCDFVKFDPIRISYPYVFRNESIKDNHFGTIVKDPYRWMEDVENPKSVGLLKTFVNEENNITRSYVEKYKLRDTLRKRFSTIWNFPKYNEFFKSENHYFQFANTGLQNQDVLYIQDSLVEPTNRRVFLDPNTLSTDGTVAISKTREFSRNGKIFAYGVSKSGSDWTTIRFRNVSSGEDLADELVKVKFTDISWKGNEGIFYGHYPLFEGDSVGTASGVNKDQKLSYHKIGTKQSDDPIIFEFKLHPNRVIASFSAVSTDEKILVLTPEAADGEGVYGYQSIYCVNISNADSKQWTTIEVVSNYEAKYKYVVNDGPIFYFVTNKNASKFHIVGININNLQENWKIIVPESKTMILDKASAINKNYILISYLDDVKSKLELRHLNGTFIKNLPIEMGSVDYNLENPNAEIFSIKFESFLVPNRIYYLDFTNTVATEVELQIYQDVLIPGFNPSDYVTDQVKYTSKDGTLIPMFIIHKKTLKKNKENPVMLYGYGGFDINILPTFVLKRIVFLQNFQGVMAIANLRGGGELGVEWHTAGNLKNKQNVFDDFQAAAEYLIANEYTHPGKLIIEGKSNGGLLIGACVNQRPDLFGAAIASVGVMDMLRFHLFTIGSHWISEYGSPENPEYFPYIYRYSPLHNIKIPDNSSVQYPAVLVMTSDHDDRVVPVHSYKYAAQLQYVLGKSQRQKNPLLLRVETEAGHGSGKPISKQIDEQVDIFSFIGQSLSLEYKDD